MQLVWQPAGVRQLKLGCEEVEEERARVGGDAVVLCLWLNVEPVRLRGDQSMRCTASTTSPNYDNASDLLALQHGTFGIYYSDRLLIGSNTDVYFGILTFHVRGSR